MSATIIDSKIFGDMFSDAAMRQVWSDEIRTAKYLDIERALAKAQGELGIIPKEAAEEIVKNCELSTIDWAKLKAKTEAIGYPIIAVVNHINASCGTNWANTVTGVRRRRILRTPPPYCRSAKAWH